MARKTAEGDNKTSGKISMKDRFLNDCMDLINRIVTKISENKGLENLLTTYGCESSANFSQLMRKRRNFNENDVFQLSLLVEHIMKARTKRRDDYIKEIIKIQKKIFDVRKNSEVYALKEIKRKSKILTKTKIMQFGLFKGLRLSAIERQSINWQEKYQLTVQDYEKQSNIGLLESMVQEIKDTYEVEQQVFIRCLEKLRGQEKRRSKTSILKEEYFLPFKIA